MAGEVDFILFVINKNGLYSANINIVSFCNQIGTDRLPLLLLINVTSLESAQRSQNGAMGKLR